VAARELTEVTGERVSTPAGGFNPTWQRHVAAYAHCAGLLPEGKALDLGCGVGHSYELLAPRESVGLDLEPSVLVGQDRETQAGDMRALPFADASFDSVLSVQAIEHVPDPQRVVAEVRRVLRPGGVAVFVTPNRLTFGVAGEIIDPYHHVEFSAAELELRCRESFDAVEVRGIFGSRRYLDLVAAERRRLERLLRLDPLRLRRLLPRRLRQRLYDHGLRRQRSAADPAAAAITREDFALRGEPLAEALDLVAICRAEPGSDHPRGVG
jgi:SAM-dependent methyltransferase